MAEIPELTDDEWAELTERLTHYASCRLVRKTWRGLRVKAGDSVVKGHEAADLAAEAIVRVINGERESWNKESYPDFLHFLMSIVDSQISTLVRSLENRVTSRIDHPRAGEPWSDASSVRSRVLQPDQACESAEWLEKFKTAVAKELGDDSISKGLFECLDAGLTDRAEIAEMLDMGVNDIYNAQKRLKLKVRAVQKKFDQGRKQ